MRAKEWAQRLANDPEGGLLKEFFFEIDTVARSWGGSDRARERAVREQEDKWRALCRLLPRYTPEMFASLLARYVPELVRDRSVERELEKEGSP